ncbi:copper amine oxidase N-terminal domain-containing protein [Paenibacillus taichungensis]|uniref:copper amine oxidase N-terminal domain-containing protein n=1 Tax=Paenibacillus taichungensis TaxID=484184 RepID=UPI002870DB27|nr:copper amine oxidase N-terminal domain-containing protein [Paenibacillus taichungensis]MDR9748537.1 copper amine oxidase N-terminal domain-containing protein [Paenibacillus taichungensis]
MNKKRVFATFVSVSLLLNATTVLAHPGRTDAYGGHTCWTNCTKWGLEYGQYHYHNGGSSSSSSTKSSSSSSSKSSSSSSTSKATKPKESKPKYTQSNLKVYINDKKVDFTNKPLQYEGNNLVPLRDISEALKATFAYYPESGTIGITKGKHKVTLTLGSKKVFYNGDSNTLSVAPKVINGITYIPVQSIKGLGATMGFDSSNNTLDIQI